MAEPEQIPAPNQILPDSQTPGGGPTALNLGAPTPSPNPQPQENLPMAPATPGRTQPTAPLPPPKPGSMFGNLSHAFIGSVLGALAGKSEVAGYQIDPDTGIQKPVYKDLHPRDQIAKIAQNALLGLAAGGQAEVQEQRSGLAKALVGAGAGTTESYTRGKQEDILKRQQANTQFEQEQQARLHQLTNAHLILENMTARKALQNADLQSNQNMAAVGNDALEAAIAGGNSVAGKANMDSSEMAQFRADHPIGSADPYTKYTPLITRANLEVDSEGNPVIDPQTGIQKVQRAYTFVDLQKPVQLTQAMIDHLNQVNFPGADKLTAGQTLDPREFQATIWNGLKMYNAANMDAKNWRIEQSTDDKGNIRQYSINDVTGVVHPLIDPDTKQPLLGKVETEKTDIFDPTTQKTGQWIIKKNNGQKISYVGESPKDINSLANAIGDFTKFGNDFLMSIPIQMRDVVSKTAFYHLDPAVLGRSANRGQVVEAAVHLNPNFDGPNYKLRYDWVNNYQGEGPVGQSRMRMNTAVAHLDLLASASKALAQNNVTLLNQYANAIGTATGDSAKVVYDAIALKAASEAAGAQKGTASPTDQDIQNNFKQFNSSLAPQTQMGNVAAQYLLLKSQENTLRDLFIQNMNGSTPEQLGRPVLSDNNQKIMDKWISSPQAGAVTSGQSVTQTNIPTNPTPQTHVFDPAAWSQTNPGQDIEAAKAEARRQNYKIKGE